MQHSISNPININDSPTKYVIMVEEPLAEDEQVEIKSKLQEIEQSVDGIKYYHTRHERQIIELSDAYQSLNEQYTHLLDTQINEYQSLHTNYVHLVNAINTSTRTTNDRFKEIEDHITLYQRFFLSSSSIVQHPEQITTTTTTSSSNSHSRKCCCCIIL